MYGFKDQLKGIPVTGLSAERQGSRRYSAAGMRERLELMPVLHKCAVSAVRSAFRELRELGQRPREPSGEPHDHGKRGAAAGAKFLEAGSANGELEGQARPAHRVLLELLLERVMETGGVQPEDQARGRFGQPGVRSLGVAGYEALGRTAQ